MERLPLSVISTDSSKEFGGSSQLEGGNFSFYQCFKELLTAFTEDVNLNFKNKFINDLNIRFGRFSDLDRNKSDIILFHIQFDYNIDDVPVELPLALIDL